MKFLRILYLLFAVMFFISSCSRVSKRLLTAESLIETAPDSAQAILDASDYQTLSDNDKALYGLLTIQLRDVKLLPLEPDSLLLFSIQYYQHSQREPDKLAACYLYKGRQLKNNLNYEAAMEFYLAALDVLNTRDNAFLKGLVYFDLGVINNLQRDYVQARRKFWTSYKQHVKAKNSKYAFYSILYVGRTYNEQKNYKQALRHYRKYHTIASDSIERASLYQEIALNYYDLKQYDSAKHYLKQILHYPYIRNNRAFRYMLLADLYFDTQQYDSAQHLATEAFRYQPDLRTQLNCNRILVNCASVQNRTNDLQRHMLAYQQCDDSLRRIDSQTKGSYIESMHQTQQELHSSRAWIWMLLFFLLSLIAASWLVYRKKHRKVTQLIQLKEQDHTQQKAEMRKDSMTKKRASLFAEIERIKAMQNQLGTSDSSLTERVTKLYNDLLHIQNVDLFFADMDSALNNIVSKLRRVCPDLSDKELMFCCLQLLQLPMHDMLILLNYESVNSLKGMKRRLAPKLALADASKINDYLIELLAAD